MASLTELKVKAATPREREFVLSDGNGLYLRVRLSGKSWIYRYKQEGKQVKLGLGHYPTVSLATARRKAKAEIERLADGIDPKDARRLEHERERVAMLNTFELMARAWHAQAWKDCQWSAGYADKVMAQMKVHLFPWLGSLPMENIPPTVLVRCLHRIRDRGFLETAQRVRAFAEHVFQYAVDLGVLEPAKNFVNNKTAGLPPPRSRHYAAITDPKQLGQLLRDIQAYNGQFVTRAALRIMPMVFQRPGQLRLADWKDISLAQQIWRCPPENMKLRAWQKRDSRTPRPFGALVQTGSCDPAGASRADRSDRPGLSQHG